MAKRRVTRGEVVHTEAWGTILLLVVSYGLGSLVKILVSNKKPRKKEDDLC